MIRSEAEYQTALKQLGADRLFASKQRHALASTGLTAAEVKRAMEPLVSYHAQLSEEIEWYENVRRRHFAPINKLTDIGRILIALRIADGLSQRDLAERLGVTEAVVSRDERNEYHNVTVERAQRILDALNEAVVTTVAEASLDVGRRDLASAMA